MVAWAALVVSAGLVRSAGLVGSAAPESLAASAELGERVESAARVELVDRVGPAVPAALAVLLPKAVTVGRTIRRIAAARRTATRPLRTGSAGPTGAALGRATAPQAEPVAALVRATVVVVLVVGPEWIGRVEWAAPAAPVAPAATRSVAGTSRVTVVERAAATEEEEQEVRADSVVARAPRDSVGHHPGAASVAARAASTVRAHDPAHPVARRAWAPAAAVDAVAAEGADDEKDNS